MSHPNAFSPEDLEALTGYSRPADIERWCHDNKVRYFRSRAGIWTTLDAVNLALGIKPTGEPERRKIDF